MSFSDFDRHMMQIALTMARRGLGAVAPNPAVGAVVADEAAGEVIARGVTQPGGRPHAETEALKRAGARARGATLYVTLEPCAHHGRTPPCAEAVVAAGIGRVVIGVEDPDPRTRGAGIARLRAAGIAVEIGCEAEVAHRVTLGHILRVTARRPFVQLKMALAEDGSVPRGAGGRALMVTGPEARAMAHLLRAEADAILVGAGTARDDDPALTCRLPGLAARSPIRVVLSRSLDLAPDLQVFRTAREVPTWVFTSADADVDRVRSLEALGVRVSALSPPPCGEGAGVGGTTMADAAASPPPGLPHVMSETCLRHEGGGEEVGAYSVQDVLQRLADEGVTRLLVEGGSAVWAAFAAAGLADEVILLQAGGARDTGSGAAALALRHAPGLDLVPVDTRRLGADRMTVLRARRAGAA